MSQKIAEARDLRFWVLDLRFWILGKWSEFLNQAGLGTKRILETDGMGCLVSRARCFVTD
jgi:hypothetical protein